MKVKSKQFMSGTDWDSLWEVRGKKVTVNQIFLSKLRYIGQIYTINIYITKEIGEKIYFFLKRKKRRPPALWLNFPFGKDTQLNSLRIKWIQSLLNPTNALWKDLMLYRLNLILNSNQCLALFRQKNSIGLMNRKMSKNKP